MYEKLHQEEENQVKKDFISPKLKVVMIVVGTFISLILFVHLNNKIRTLQEWEDANYRKYFASKSETIKTLTQKNQKLLLQIEEKKKQSKDLISNQNQQSQTLKPEENSKSQSQNHENKEPVNTKNEQNQNPQNTELKGSDDDVDAVENQHLLRLTDFDSTVDLPEDMSIEIDKETKKKLYKSFWQQIEETFLPANTYFQVSKIKNFKQLPICIMVDERVWGQNFAISLDFQNYTNYHTVVLGQKTSDIDSKNKVDFVGQLKDQSYYFQLKEILEQYCKPKEIVFIGKSPFKDQNSLQIVNKDFQTLKIWLSYENFNTTYQITSFYREIFFAVQLNDFSHSNLQFLSEANFDCLVIALLELTSRFIIQSASERYFIDQQVKDKGIFIATQSAVRIYRSHRKKYEPLHIMSNNAPIKEDSGQNYKKRFYNNRKQDNFIERENIERFLDMVQLKNLPQNHTLFQLDDMYYEKKYHLSSLENQKPFCVVIPSYNNIPNNRYKKILYTIHYQKYTNYHIVFIDDHSIDDTLEESKKYAFQELKFPQEKILFYQNKRQRFATYNIRLAANNFCKPTEVFVLVDGDDELVGRNVFNLINFAYQKNQNWVVYTNFYSTQYKVGTSKIVPQFFFEHDYFYRRYPRHFFGMVRTFMTKLYLRIYEKDHRDLQHKFFEILYDQSLQAPLFELAGRRIQYIPELCYLYNRYTEVNIEARKNLKPRKQYLAKLLKLRKPYQALDSL